MEYFNFLKNKIINSIIYVFDKLYEGLFFIDVKKMIKI